MVLTAPAPTQVVLRNVVYSDVHQASAALQPAGHRKHAVGRSLAAIRSTLEHPRHQVFGYPLLFLLVMGESSGRADPRRDGLIAGGVLASQGKLEIELVIPLAAAAAIVGDNIGYLIGRKGGRWLLERPGRFERQRQQVLATGEPFFERHGPKAVFFGRFVLGLRVWASWLAGATHMPWRSFVLWNALGGICWATAVGLLAYFLGHSRRQRDRSLRPVRPRRPAGVGARRRAPAPSVACTVASRRAAERAA